jgi:hypothetical protein
MKMLGLENRCELISTFEITFRCRPTVFVLINATKEWLNFAYFLCRIRDKNSSLLLLNNDYKSSHLLGKSLRWLYQCSKLGFVTYSSWFLTDNWMLPSCRFSSLGGGKGGRRKLDTKGVSTGEDGQGACFFQYIFCQKRSSLNFVQRFSFKVQRFNASLFITFPFKWCICIPVLLFSTELQWYGQGADID